MFYVHISPSSSARNFVVCGGGGHVTTKISQVRWLLFEGRLDARTQVMKRQWTTNRLPVHMG